MSCVDEKIIEETNKILEKYKKEKDNLIPILNNISVCLGTACFVKGSQAIFDRLKERLKLEDGQTSADGKFSIDTTRCVGACGIAPVFTVNNEVYGHATVKKLDEVLDKLEKEG